MVTKNIKNASNGTLFIVRKMFPGKVIIETINAKKEIECHEETWEQFQYGWDQANNKISSKK